MRILARPMVGLFLAGAMLALLPGQSWTEPSQDAGSLIAMHRQSAEEARQEAAFHQKMAQQVMAHRSNAKIDMVSHCKFWADHYLKLAAQEDQAAKELQRFSTASAKPIE